MAGKFSILINENQLNDLRKHHELWISYNWENISKNFTLGGVWITADYDIICDLQTLV